MKRTFMIGFIISIVVSIAGCAGTPGYIKESSSHFDNATEISLEPGWLSGGGLTGSSIKLGLFKRSTMPEEEIILVAVVMGAHSIANGKSLHFNIDGEIIHLESIDASTDIETHSGAHAGGIYIPAYNESSKRYRIDTAFLERILMAEKVVVRLELSKTYAEGLFSYDAPTMARPAFRRFYERITSIQK